jgi:HlyD family secretion protein
VTAVNVTAGERSASDSSAIQVSDLGSLEVDISLDETDVADVHAGQSATISLDAFPDSVITGTVKSVSVVATTSSGVVLYPVTVSLGPSDVAPRPGMTADVDIVLDSVADALIVPLKAVVSGPNGVSFVVRTQAASGSEGAARFGLGAAPTGGRTMPGGGAPPPFGTPGATGRRAQTAKGGGAPVRVEVGLTNDSFAQVLSGLEEGDVVVVRSSGSSSNGGFRGMGGPPDELGGMMIRVP